MKIRCTNKSTAHIGLNGEVADFTNGIATVSKELGEALIAKYPEAIKAVKTARKSTEDREE